MKKFMMIAACAAMIIPFVSCQEIDYGGKPTAKIEKATYSSSAKKVTFSGTAAEKGFKELELTDGGYYFLWKEKAKAGDDQELVTGTYILEGAIYVLSNFGKVTFDSSNNNVTIEITGGETVTATYEEVAKVSENDYTNAMAHSWLIDKIDISVVADGKNIGLVKEGCNLEQIGKELVAQAKELGAKVDVNVDQLKGYNVTKLTFTSSNSLIIEFTEAKTFKADVKGIEGYKFSYKIEKGESNEIINGEAECEFIPQTASTAWLRVNVKSGDNFTGRVIFMMSMADAL